MKKLKTMTLGELKMQLAWLWTLSDDTEITFGTGDLSFNTAKTYQHAPDNKTPLGVQIRFNEVYKVVVDPHDD